MSNFLVGAIVFQLNSLFIYITMPERHTKYIMPFTFPIFTRVSVVGWAALALIGTALVSGCTYHDEETYFDNPTCSTLDMSYANDIAPILDQGGCLSCHNDGFASGGVSLQGYDAAREMALSGRLMGSIKHETGFAWMPQGMPQLDKCYIDKISAWIDQGTLNN